MKISYDGWTMKNQIDRCYSQSQKFKINAISLYDDIDDDDTENELELEFASKDYYVQSTSVENKNMNDKNLELLAIKRNQEKMKKRAQAKERYLSVKAARSGVYHHDDFKQKSSFKKISAKIQKSESVEKQKKIKLADVLKSRTDINLLVKQILD